MSDDLLNLCQTCFEVGMSFPMVWDHLLRYHPDVRGERINITDGDRSWTEIPLSSGQHLVFEKPIGYWLIEQFDLIVRARMTAKLAPERARAFRFRQKAEELRAKADDMYSSARDTLLQLADTYDNLADGAERWA